MTAVRTVLFDWDGTIVDSHDAILNSYRTVIERHTGRKVEFSEPQGRRMLGRRPHEVFAEYGLEDVEAGVADYSEAYVTASASGSETFPGIRETLEALAGAGLRLGIVTNKGHERLAADVGRLRLDGLFDFEVCAEDTLLRKPHPDPILLAISRAGVDRASVVYVGDNPVDIVAAHAAGVRAVAAGWGPFPADQLARRRPWLVLDDPYQLVPAVVGGSGDREASSAMRAPEGVGPKPMLSVVIAPDAGVGRQLFGGDLEGAVTSAMAARWNGLEFAVRDPAAVDVEAVRSAMDGHPITVTAVSTDRMAREDGLRLDEPGSIPELLGRLREAFELARRLGCPIVLGEVLGSHPAHSPEFLELLQAWSREQTASGAAVPVLFEPGIRFCRPWARTVGEALEAMETLPIPDPGLSLSIFHLAMEETSVPDALLAAGEDLRMVHLADNNGLAPGLGGLDFGPVFDALGRMGYRETLALACEARPDSVSALAYATGTLRAHMRFDVDRSQDATEAAAFDGARRA